MTIPECREELRSLIRRLRVVVTTPAHKSELKSILRQLRLIERQMYRRRRKRRAAPESNPVTPDLIRKIRKYAIEHPRASYKEMGALYGVSIGRVSEALAGKRGKQ